MEIISGRRDAKLDTTCPHCGTRYVANLEDCHLYRGINGWGEEKLAWFCACPGCAKESKIHRGPWPKRETP